MTRRRPVLDALDSEIREHIDAETRENVERGMSEDAARAAAVRKFGNIIRVREDVRDVWVWAWWDGCRQDARDAIRRLQRNPGFAIAIAATLALGIGLTTAIFSVVNAVLLRPLSYPHPDRVVWLTTRDATSGEEGPMNSVDFAEWKAQAATFDHMVAYSFLDATVVADGAASRWRIQLASEGFWNVTGARPILGSLPAANETQVLVLSHRAFRDRFHSDPQVIGRAVSMSGRQFTIGAVLPADFTPQFPAFAWRPGLDDAEIDAYRPLVLQPPPKTRDGNQMVALHLAIGQMKDGVTVDQAKAEIEAIHASQQAYLALSRPPTSAVVVPLHEKLVGASREALRILLAAALCVLLITCANVANLLMSRSSARQKEIALRMSVGSGPLRVIRQLLAESVAYAIAGGAGGLLLGWWLVNVIVSLVGPAMPRLTETTLDVRVLAFAIASSLVTALLFGIGPAIGLSRTNIQEVLKEGARSTSMSPRALLAGRTAVALQLALTVMLVAGAGLMLKSVWRMTSYPDGFTPQQILTMRVEFAGSAYREDHVRRAYADALLARARTLPGVRDAALTSGGDGRTVVVKEGQPFPDNPDSHLVPVSAVSPGFGPMLGMALVRGRWLTDNDVPDTLLINEALARREYPNVDPIGRRIRVDDDRYGTIVGVIRDMKYTRLDADAEPELFVRHTDTRLFGVTLALLMDGDPIAAAPTITKALRTVDPTQSIFSVKTLEQSLSESIAPRRFNLLLLGSFAFVALILAALGIYGVIAYSVAERTHEIGIRLALGAERRRVVAMIVRQGMAGVVLGMVIGIASALGGAHVIASLLYDVEPTDPATFALATVMLAAIASIACAAPALRAAAIDPAIALRSE